MEISKALLEKYERGQCDDQERAAVQRWLDSDSWDDFEEEETTKTVKDQIWLHISDHIATNDPVVNRPKTISKRIHWSVYTAAACLLFFIGFACFYATDRDEPAADFYANNPASSLTWLHEQGFDLLLSANSSAHIDLKSKSISLSGNIMFKPKQDFTLQDSRNNRAFHFKRNETYVISDNPTDGKFVVLQKDELAFLPPTIQRRLKQQFQIS